MIIKERIFSNIMIFFPLLGMLIWLLLINIPLIKKLFNYRSLAFSNEIPHCETDFVDFIDDFHRHVVTGDSNIIQNKNLHFMMELEAKFRLNIIINKNTAIQIFERDLNKFTMQLCYKFNTPFKAFSDMMKEFEFFVNSELNSKDYVYHSLNKEDLNYIKFLHTIFVIVPVDKAASNYAIICIDKVK